ncbi:MAG: hypothetical protein R6U46_08725 [Marinilabilia sp.]
MTLPSLSAEEIRKAAKREDLIRETAAQIIKDFAEFELDIRFSGNVNDFYQELFGQMKIHAEDILARNGAKFFNLLYRIDVDPEEIDRYQQQFPEGTLSEIITELIIHRELKKVMIRDYFRQSNH